MTGKSKEVDEAARESLVTFKVQNREREKWISKRREDKNLSNSAKETKVRKDIN